MTYSPNLESTSHNPAPPSTSYTTRLIITCSYFYSCLYHPSALVSLDTAGCTDPSLSSIAKTLSKPCPATSTLASEPSRSSKSVLPSPFRCDYGLLPSPPSPTSTSTSNSILILRFVQSCLSRGSTNAPPPQIHLPATPKHHLHDQLATLPLYTIYTNATHFHRMLRIGPFSLCLRRRRRCDQTVHLLRQLIHTRRPKIRKSEISGGSSGYSAHKHKLPVHWKTRYGAAGRIERAGLRTGSRW